MLLSSLPDPISDPGSSPFPPHLDFKSRPTATLAQFLTLVFKFSLQLFSTFGTLISPLTLRSLSSTTVPINLLSPHCIHLNYFTQCQQCGTLHAMTSAPLSPALPLFLHVAASRTRACWIRLAPTHQLSTLPCPLELQPPFSGTTRSLDTPAVGSPMMCCLPYAHKLGCLRLGRSRQKISTPLTQLSLLPPPPISACGCGVNVP